MVRMVPSSWLSKLMLILEISLVYFRNYRVYEPLGRLGATPPVSCMTAGLRPDRSHCCLWTVHPGVSASHFCDKTFQGNALSHPIAAYLGVLKPDQRTPFSLPSARKCFYLSCRDPFIQLGRAKKHRKLHFFLFQVNAKL